VKKCCLIHSDTIKVTKQTSHKAQGLRNPLYCETFFSARGCILESLAFHKHACKTVTLTQTVRPMQDLRQRKELGNAASLWRVRQRNDRVSGSDTTLESALGTTSAIVAKCA
jgi:hypothetical protein